MEQVKPKELYFEPDPRRSLGLSLDSLYRDVGRLGLHPGVPEGVCSYFNATVTLWLYGHLYYPFYALAATHGRMATEYALRERFPGFLVQVRGKKEKERQRKPTFQELLDHALARGVLREEGYPGLAERQERQDRLDEPARKLLGLGHKPQPEQSYVRAVARATPRLRNREAHPSYHMILPPGMALDSLIVTAETINQLWERPSESA